MLRVLVGNSRRNFLTNAGFLIHAPDAVKKQFPQFKAVESHTDLMKAIKATMA